MEIRPAEEKDLDRILEVYEDARRLMAQSGNAGQWQSGYPKAELLTRDIALGRLFKVTDKDRIVGVFAFMPGPEPDYATLQGAWLDDGPYWVIHRLAASGARGVAALVFDWAKTKTDSLRIDTHAQNAVMRHLFERHGFAYVGEITLSDGSPRRAYHWFRKNSG